jgi:hypothetical protein
VDATRFQIKLDIRSAAADLDPFVPAFHDWIRRNPTDDLLVDVVDYRHVHQGPAVLLVGHAVDYCIDRGDGSVGLLVSRKRDAPPAAERLGDLVRRAWRAAAVLAGTPALAPLEFSTDSLTLRVTDRLWLTTDADALDTCRAELSSLAGRLYPDADWSVETAASGREPPRWVLRATRRPRLAELVART